MISTPKITRTEQHDISARKIQFRKSYFKALIVLSSISIITGKDFKVN